MVKMFSIYLWLVLSAMSKLNVHMVSHTHDDTGWLKTVDEYASGSNETIQGVCTNCLIDSVILYLGLNPERKFTYVEQAFFQRWWRQSSDEQKDEARRLVHDGQLQFVNGGWCMHDEAATHYMDMIDQTTLGHRFLMEEFDYVPHVGWQIDPFGHSATQAALLSSEAGLIGLFFGRIDYQDIDKRRKNKSCEFVWDASPSLGSRSKVFAGLTGEYGGNYGPPSGFNWNGGDDPVVDDEMLFSYNVESRVEDFVNQALNLQKMTRGEHVMFTMGSDFNYRNAYRWFTNIDKIIRHVNLDGRVRAFYSTPNEYLLAKLLENSTYPVKDDDFFPYADDDDHFWTGYFTSRPALKRYVRDTSGFLQTVKQLNALNDQSSERHHDVERLKEAMGVVQHHDGVSGTEKQHVAFDYAMRMSIGREGVRDLYTKSLEALTGINALEWCPLRNESLCSVTQDTVEKSVMVVAWNPTAQNQTEVLEIPITETKGVSVLNATDEAVKFNIVPSTKTMGQYSENKNAAPYTLMFEATSPPLGFSTYRILINSSGTEHLAKQIPAADDDLYIQNDYLKVTFCNDTGRMCKVTNRKSNIEIDIKQDYFWYKSSEGTPKNNQKSGAYIFRPNSSDAIQVTKTKPTNNRILTEVVQEMRQQFGDWVSQSVKLYENANYFDIEFQVGPVPIKDNFGKEVITRFTTSIKNKGTSYTDSNGREMQKRVYNYRPTWDLKVTSEVAGNYYPVDTAIYIKDDDAQLTILTDRAMGGTGSLKTEGVMELMLHRRLLKDDSRGVGEPLNETESTIPYWNCGNLCGHSMGKGLVIRGTLRVSLESPPTAASKWRPLMDKMYLPMQLAFGAVPAESRSRVLRRALPLSKSFLATDALPSNLQILTMERTREHEILLRIGHQFGLREDVTLSDPATVDLEKLVAWDTNFTVEEMSLTANQDKASLDRKQNWNVPTDEPLKGTHWWQNKKAYKKTVFTLGPLEIKTFLLHFDH